MFKRRKRFVAAAASAVIAAGLLAGCVPGIVLQNGWTNRAFGGTDAGYRVVNGIVHLKGAIQTTGTSPLPFTLPSDARPATDVYVQVDLCNANNGRLWIKPDGTVTVQSESAFTNATCFTSLDGASYALNANGFTALSLANGWGNAPYSTGNAAVRNDGGIARLKGAIWTSGTNANPFTLPVGFRPATNVYVPVDLCNSTKGRLNVAPTGVVTVQAQGPFSNAACFTSLDGAWFALNASGFTNLALVNSWFHAPSGTSTAAVRNDGNIVHFKGAVSSGSSDLITTLPIGFRPATSVWIPIDLCNANKGRLNISQNGTVRVQAKDNAFTNAQCFTSLDGASFVVDAALDTDGDRLSNIWETNTNVYVSPDNTGTNPNVADTDGDRINDGDEVLTTNTGLNLRNMGASPVHKNIFMEFDWADDSSDGCGAHSHRPTAAQISAFHTAFRNAPVSNPDGVGGIQVISDYGQGGPFLGGNRIADADGIIAGDVTGTEFHDYKTANFSSARNGYFHYVLGLHKFNTTALNSGVAEINGDDLIVSLQCSVTDTALTANTIMHELGHNLGLLHGGNESLNWKPNYNSVMNYRYQFPGIDSDCDALGDGVLSYSIGTRLRLDEANLNEAVGVCGTRSIDWNGNLFIAGAIVDLNGNGTYDAYSDSNDWAAINLGGIADANGAPVHREVVIERPLPAELR